MARAHTPADGLLHPIAVASFALLALNDHVLKARWPGFWTGKLSDLAGMVGFPLLLVALSELWTGRAPGWAPSRRAVHWAVSATGLGFAAVKTWTPATLAWAWTWGAMQWPAHAAWALARGRPAPALRPVAVVQDPSDLLTLIGLGLALWVGWRRCEAARGSPRL